MNFERGVNVMRVSFVWHMSFHCPNEKRSLRADTAAKTVVVKTVANAAKVPTGSAFIII